MKSTDNRLQWSAVLITILITAGVVSGAGTVRSVAPVPEHTDTDVALLVIYIMMALVFSFLCSVAEAVLLSVTPSYIAGLKQNKPGFAERLKRLKQDNVDQSLAAILTLNTIAHTVGAIGSGAKATLVFGNAWFGLFSAVMTLMILFLSEIIPKTLGAVFWRKLTWFTVIFVGSLTRILYPLIWISERLTRLIARRNELQVFRRSEFAAMAKLGEEAGHIRENESRIIHNILRFESLKAKDIMTPRTVLVGLQQDLTVSKAMDLESISAFSRILLFGESLDDITGFVLKTDMLISRALDRKEEKLVTFKRDIMSVISELPLSDLLEFFLNHRQHIALVVDEYGGTKGIVTLEDVVETLLGMEILDEMDKVEDMQALARKQWKKRARAIGLQIDDLSEG
jgi:CBS domain containing-hemolysin-like protein